MPRWKDGHITKRTCPKCSGRKDFYAKFCRKCTIYPKPLLGIKGQDHPSWKCGYQIDRDGYIRTYAPDHPWPRKSGYVLEHVRKMELKIGRRLNPNEVVHHKDENKQNNDEDNLEIKQKGQHSSYHRKIDTCKRKRINGRFAPKEVLLSV